MYKNCLKGIDLKEKDDECRSETQWLKAMISIDSSATIKSESACKQHANLYRESYD